MPDPIKIGHLSGLAVAQLAQTMSTDLEPNPVLALGFKYGLTIVLKLKRGASNLVLPNSQPEPKPGPQDQDLNPQPYFPVVPVLEPSPHFDHDVDPVGVLNAYGALNCNVMDKERTATKLNLSTVSSNLKPDPYKPSHDGTLENSVPDQTKQVSPT